MEPICVEIWRDNAFVEECKHFDHAFVRLLWIQSCSVYHALRYEGWQFIPIYEDANRYTKGETK